MRDQKSGNAVHIIRGEKRQRRITADIAYHGRPGIVAVGNGLLVDRAPENLDFREPGPLLIDMRGSLGREGQQSDTPGAMSLRMEVSGTLAQNEGRGTLRSYRECRLDYFLERYVFHVVDWVRAKWKTDPGRTSGTKGMSLHLAIRHPEVFKVFWPDRPEFFQNDFDYK